MNANTLSQRCSESTCPILNKYIVFEIMPVFPKENRHLFYKIQRGDRHFPLRYADTP